MHPVADLARKAIEEYLLHRRVLPPPEKVTPEMTQHAGVFVSLKKQGELRGCIGTFMPLCDTVAEEIIRNAIASATQDPRFRPVTEDELPALTISVDILSPPEKITGMSELDPERYGVIVARGGRRGLLLPSIDGVDSVEEQVRIAKMKAGINSSEEVDLFRFEVKRYR